MDDVDTIDFPENGDDDSFLDEQGCSEEMSVFADEGEESAEGLAVPTHLRR
jgi:hypothetical protein